MKKLHLVRRMKSMVVYWVNDKWIFPDVVCSRRITHWMPLPEPPPGVCMTKCKHDPDQVYCDKCHHEEMTMTDSLQKIIDTIDCNIKDLTAQGEHDIAGLLFQYKDRLETLQKQPVAYDNGKGYLCSAFHKKKYPAYKECAIPLIRGD